MIAAVWLIHVGKGKEALEPEGQLVRPTFLLALKQTGAGYHEGQSFFTPTLRLRMIRSPQSAGG